MIKRLSAALSLAVLLQVTAAPVLAEGCRSDPVKMTCAEGAVWDAAKGICAPKPSA